MKNCLLLLLSIDHLYVQHRVGGKIASHYQFNHSAKDFIEFANFLDDINCPTFLLTDLIEEDFRIEVIPHLRGQDRRALLNRKFEQFYRGTPYSQATFLKRQTTGRRDDEILFSALTNPGLISPWVDVLLEHKIPLAGIYSMPQISLPLIKDSPSNHLLLITWNRFSGLRETYFSGRRLQISRLSPINNEAGFQKAVTAELGRTYLYLKSLSLLPVGQVLDVRIVGHRDDLLALESQLPQSGDMRFDFVDLAVLAEQAGITSHIDDSDANPIFLQQLATQNTKNQYGSSEHIHYFSLWKLRRSLYWSSLILVIGSFFWSLFTVAFQNTPDDNALAVVKKQISFVKKQTVELRTSLPSSGVSATDMRSVVQTMQSLAKLSVPPEQLLKPLSYEMDKFPNVALDELSWKSTPAEPVAPQTDPTYAAEVITFKGHLDQFSRDDRVLSNYLDQFQAGLTQAGYEVKILSRSLDFSPQSNLSDQNTLINATQSFVLRLTWRPAL